MTNKIYVYANKQTGEKLVQYVTVGIEGDKITEYIVTDNYANNDINFVWVSNQIFQIELNRAKSHIENNDMVFANFNICE